MIKNIRKNIFFKIFALFFLFVNSLSISSAIVERIDLGKKIISIDLPEDAKISRLESEFDTVGSVFRLRFGNANNFSCNLMFVNESATPADMSNENIKRWHETASAQFIDISVEGKIELKPLDIDSGFGVYSVFTDKNLVGKPYIEGDYKTITTLTCQFHDSVILSSSIFSDDVESKYFKSTLRMIELISIVHK